MYVSESCFTNIFQLSIIKAGKFPSVFANAEISTPIPGAWGETYQKLKQ
jgi:hypothetical protein